MNHRTCQPTATQHHQNNITHNHRDPHLNQTMIHYDPHLDHNYEPHSDLHLDHNYEPHSDLHLDYNHEPHRDPSWPIPWTIELETNPYHIPNTHREHKPWPQPITATTTTEEHDCEQSPPQKKDPQRAKPKPMAANPRRANPRSMASTPTVANLDPRWAHLDFIQQPKHNPNSNPISTQTPT